METRLILKISDCGIKIARTILYASFVQEIIQPFIEEGNVLLLALIRHHVHVADPWRLGP